MNEIKTSEAPFKVGDRVQPIANQKFYTELGFKNATLTVSLVRLCKSGWRIQAGSANHRGCKWSFDADQLKAVEVSA